MMWSSRKKRILLSRYVFFHSGKVLQNAAKHDRVGFGMFYMQITTKDLNDALLPTLMGRLMAETRVSHDRRVTANMASE